MSNDMIMHFVFYWLLPFAVAIGGFLLLIKNGQQLYKRLDMDRIWHLFVRIGLVVGGLMLFWIWFKSTGIPANIAVYAEKGIEYAKHVEGIMKYWTLLLVYIARFVTFLIHWAPIYLRAFIVSWVIGSAIEIQALVWRIRFVYATNVIIPTALLAPLLTFKYFLGYQTPFFDYLHGRLFAAMVKENSNDGWGYALQGFDDKGQKFENGTGGSVQTAKIQNAGLSVRWSKSQVVTKGGNRHAELIIRRSREVEADNLLRTALKGFGQRLSAPNIRFQDDPLEDFEVSKGFKFDSDVDYNAGDNLGSWRTIFVNPFTADNKIKNGGRGAYKVFEGVLIGMLQYIFKVTPVAVADKLDKRAKQLFSIDHSADKAKYKAQQNLDLDVVPVPKDPSTGNTIDEQKVLALDKAKKRISDVTNALNANKIRGTFDGVIVGGNTAVYQYTLPRTADLPSDFAKIQENVANMLKASDIPIIKVQAGVLTLTMVNGVNIPVDFREMVKNRKIGMPSIISGMAGVDALGNNIYFELGDKNPHGMLFGKTGTGKTVTIMTILYSIMSAVDPEMLKIAYVDGKGNSFEFMRTDNNDSPDYHPNPFTYAQPADASGDIEYARALIKHIERETRRRIQLFKEEAVTKLADYNKKNPDKKMPEILFVVDEFSAITQQDKNLKASEMAEKGTVDTFEYIAKMSRSVGIRMLLANQSARKELVPGKISANVTGRVSLGVAEPIESEIALPDAKIAVHLVSQAGEFYSIMNGVRNPEHGNSPNLPDDVMHALNASLEKKFGHHDYVITREQVLEEQSGGGSDSKPAPMPDPLPTKETPMDDLLALIEKYPEWAVANAKSDVITKNEAVMKVTPRQRKKLLSVVSKAIDQAKAQVEAMKESGTAKTHKSTGSRVAGITRGKDKGIL